MRCACAPAKFLDKNGASEQLGLRRILKAVPARPEPVQSPAPSATWKGMDGPRDGSWRGCHRDCVGPPALSVHTCPRIKRKRVMNVSGLSRKAVRMPNRKRCGGPGPAGAAVAAGGVEWRSHPAPAVAPGRDVTEPLPEPLF